VRSALCSCKTAHCKIVGHLSINSPSDQLSSRTPPATLSRESRPPVVCSFGLTKRHAVESGYSGNRAANLSATMKGLLAPK